MSLIRGKNTSPEKLVFSHLRKEKVYFKRHYTRVPGSPDGAIPRKRVAVFIDGDFWHGLKFADRKLTLPEYWVNKISRNIRRDKRNWASLRKEGWQVLRIWEHQLKRRFTRARYLENIKDFLLSK